MLTILRRLLPAAVLLSLAVPAPALAGDPSPPPYRSLVLAADPTAYWRLGETAGSVVAADETGNHPGRYSGAPTLEVPHPLGPGAGGIDDDTAIDLDGLQTLPLGQFVHVADRDHVAFAGRAAFSLEAWIHPRGKNGVTRRILSKEGPDGGWLLGMRAGQLVFSRYADGAWSTLATGVEPTRWSHVAATFDGTTMSLFVDGWLAAQGPSRIDLPINRADLSIGAKQSRWRFFAGGLDEVAIYPRQLTYGQIHSHARVGGGVR
jgi:hypothetical protein